MSLSRTVDRLLGLTLWGSVVASRALAAKLGKVWVRSFGVDSELPHWQPYGVQSRPLPGAEAIVLSMGSHPGERLALLVGDRRYTIALEAGEVCLVDDLGQRFHLARTGAIVEAPSIKLGAGATLGVARETDPVGVSALWNTWLDAVATATSTTAAKTAADAEALGTITTGSSVTRSE